MLLCFFYFFVQLESHSVSQASLKLIILLLQPSECWYYRDMPPRLACYVDFKNIFFKSQGGSLCLKF